MHFQKGWLGLGMLVGGGALLGWGWEAVPRWVESWVVAVPRQVESWVVGAEHLMMSGVVGALLWLGIVFSGLVGLLMLLGLFMTLAGQYGSHNEPRYPRGRARARKADASRR